MFSEIMGIKILKHITNKDRLCERSEPRSYPYSFADKLGYFSLYGGFVGKGNKLTP